MCVRVCVCLHRSGCSLQYGTVLLDGVDLADINTPSLRSVIGIVSQEPSLFAVSIAENISYGLKGIVDTPIPREDIIRASHLANAHRFIATFPDGYDTLVWTVTDLSVCVCVVVAAVECAPPVLHWLAG